ncbi:MAG: M3 family metallopeptidase [Planctomycetaceae bacterium]
MNTAAPELKDNPLLVSDGIPPFDKILPEHVVPAVRHVLAEAEKQLAELEKNVKPTWSSTIEACDKLGLPFQYAWGPVSHLMGVKNSPEIREAHEEVLGEMVSFGLRMSQSEPIYNALKELKSSAEWNQLDEAQKRIVDDRILDAELAGIALDEKKREHFNEISRELSQLSTDFSNHVLDATKAFELVLDNQADVEGMPPSLLQLASQSYNTANKESGKSGTAEAGPWRFTLDFPSYGPFMQHCRRSDLREKLYRAFITRASSRKLNNDPLITKILKLRREQAAMLGYGNYAEMSLAEKMAPDVKAVVTLLEQLRKAAWKPAERDLEDLKTLAKESGVTEKLWNWDIAYWSERLREKRFDFTDEQLRPYFPLERVLDGLFSLAERLFGIKVTAADGKAPIWHDDVRFFHVADENGRQIAAFYLDPYSRPENKKPGAWMDDCLVRRKMAGKLQLPIAHLVCNSTPPLGNKPSLMTFREVETLFHEFGHGLQHMLTTVDYADAAGINGVEWDAVELPSQFMENWCYHRPTLLGMTAHYETGEPLPIELFEKICKARTFQSGMMTLRQILFGLTDIELHSNYDPDSSEPPFAVQRKIAEKTSVLPMLPEDRSLCAFSHIFAGGYAAGYYSYKWAEVLSADAFSAFEEAGLDNEEAVAKTGRRFRDTVLSLGGGRHPMQVFEDFRGRQPTPDALLRHNGLA